MKPQNKIDMTKEVFFSYLRLVSHKNIQFHQNSSCCFHIGKWKNITQVFQIIFRKKITQAVGQFKEAKLILMKLLI
jgi:hypothetical protein